MPKTRHPHNSSAIPDWVKAASALRQYLGYDAVGSLKVTPEAGRLCKRAWKDFKLNSNFRLNVLSLKRIENATAEDKAWNIDKWAELFKAKTWEELRMVAQYDHAFLEAAERILANNTEENRRWLFLAFQDAENHEKRMKKEIKELSEQNAELSEQNAELNNHNAELSERLAKRDEQLAERDEQLAELSEQILDKDALIERLKRELQKVKI